MTNKMAASLVLWLMASCFGETVCPRHIETPTYPTVARVARAQGKVTLNVTIDGEGKVSNVVATGDPLHQAQSVFQKSAIDNIRHWTFEKPTSAPLMQVIVYEFKFDSSLPTSRENYPITQVNLDLPDRVTVLVNELVVTGQSKRKKLKVRP